jgi:hypothetical protein
MADALKARCVLADVRWRWTLKVMWTAACTERNLCADPTLPDRGRSRHQSAFAIRSRVVARSEARKARQAFGDLPGERRRNNLLSRVFARNRRDDGPIFLQVPSDSAVAGGAEQPDSVIPLGAQCGDGGLECVDASRWECTLEAI